MNNKIRKKYSKEFKEDAILKSSITERDFIPTWAVSAQGFLNKGVLGKRRLKKVSEVT